MNEELKKMNIMMKALIRYTDRLLSVPSWFNEALPMSLFWRM